MTNRITSSVAENNNFFDLSSLNSIRQQSNETNAAAKGEALEKAAKQFEAIFMQMLLKSMRSAQDVLESDSPFNSQTTKFYRDMHDQQLAVELSSNGTLGLSELIVRQLGGDQGNYKPHSVLRTGGEFAGDFTELKAKQQQANNGQALLLPTVNKIENASQKQKADGFALVKSMASVNSQNSGEQHKFNQPEDFVTALVEPAKQVEQRLGVPFQVVIAQSALETGWGQKIINTRQGQSSNNLFNIKADKRWQGDKTNTETLEYLQGAMVKKTEPFRVYGSLTESVNDYVNFLTENSRYQPVIEQTQQAFGFSEKVEQFLQGLQGVGYATDPNYANKVLGTLKRVTQVLSQEH